MNDNFYLIREFLSSLGSDTVMLSREQKEKAFACLVALEDLQKDYNNLEKQFLKYIKKCNK